MWWIFLNNEPLFGFNLKIYHSFLNYSINIRYVSIIFFLYVHLLLNTTIKKCCSIINQRIVFIKRFKVRKFNRSRKWKKSVKVKFILCVSSTSNFRCNLHCNNALSTTTIQSIVLCIIPMTATTVTVCLMNNDLQNRRKCFVSLYYIRRITRDAIKKKIHKYIETALSLKTDSFTFKPVDTRPEIISHNTV